MAEGHPQHFSSLALMYKEHFWLSSAAHTCNLLHSVAHHLKDSNYSVAFHHEQNDASSPVEAIFPIVLDDLLSCSLHKDHKGHPLPCCHDLVAQEDVKHSRTHLQCVVDHQHVCHLALVVKHAAEALLIVSAHDQDTQQVEEHAVEVQEEVLQMHAGIHVTLQALLVVHAGC